MNGKTWLLVMVLFSSALAWGQVAQPALPSFDSDQAEAHQLKPHRRSIPQEGVGQGYNQFHLRLTVSPGGDVVKVSVDGEDRLMKYWPQVESEVYQWKYRPFEVDGRAATVEVEAYVDLVPPERLPKRHVTAPKITKNSQIEIELERTGCFGECPGYVVTVRPEGIVFQGRFLDVAVGHHTAKVDADEVRKLAQSMVATDFYSLEDTYRAGVTDSPTYLLTLTIDGRKKQILDYVGQWVGMPAIVRELEEKVDELAGTARWIEGEAGLVEALKAEGFNFDSHEAQVVLKEALSRGKVQTAHELLEAGVPLKLYPAPKVKDGYSQPLLANAGWLMAASRHLEALRVMIAAGASKEAVEDKTRALVGAARSGNVESVRALIAYGADPNADLGSYVMTESGGGMTTTYEGRGGILNYAAESGNPEVVREFLRYHPKLEVRNHQGQTALFAAGEYRYNDKEGARAECARLLIAAGADVNARDNEGNTPLHEIFLEDVLEELLKHGADVNARNNDGETPIFTNVDNDALPLFLQYGADPYIRNNAGQTVWEANRMGPKRIEALEKAIADWKQKKN